IGAAKISVHPKDQSVSLGANVTFSVSVSGTAPFAYQWRSNSVDIPGATKSTLTVTNVSPANSGQRYSVRVNNALGFSVSQEATLTIDPTFTKITTGTILDELKGPEYAYWGSAWPDFNNDGLVDLFVGVGTAGNASFLFENTGQGNFTEVPFNFITGTWGGVWGDFDNDGFPDMF